jgi:hypothetical protein
MFPGIWAWIVRVAKWLLKRCTKQWYLVEVKTNAHNDWGEYYPTHCASLRDAKAYLVGVTDTYFWVKCRILDPDGNVVSESAANDFYDAPPDIVTMYVETDMSCEAALQVWRKQELRRMDNRKCSDVQQ